MVPRTLIFFPSDRESYRDTLFSSDEVFCSPQCRTRYEGARRTIRAPLGRYDVAEVLDRLPEGWRPDLVVVKANASDTSLPRGLSQLNCPRVLLADCADALDYALAEGFDFVASDGQRQHLHWFAEAGVRHVAWMPALTETVRHRPLDLVHPLPLSHVEQGDTNVPYKRYVLRGLQGAALGLQCEAAAGDEAAEIYARSAGTVVFSTNGGVNARVFDVLAAGGFLITDRLAPEAGLDVLLEDGTHYVTFADPDDAIRKVKHYQGHPELALEVRRHGQERFLSELAPEIRLGQFMEWVFSGRVAPGMAVSADRPNVGAAALRNRLALCEVIKDIHLHALSVEVALVGGSREPDAVLDAAGLSRLTIVARAATADVAGCPAAALFPDKGVLAAQRITVLPPACNEADLLWAVGSGAWILAAADVAPRLVALGFEPVVEAEGLFCRRHVAAAVEALAAAGCSSAAQELLSECVLNAGQDEVAALAAVARDQGRADLSHALLRRQARQHRGDVALLRALSDAQQADGFAAEAWISLAEAASAEGAHRPPVYAGRIGDDQVSSYIARVDPVPASAISRTLNILVVTNLFPPQEMGGYGRQMWEYVRELERRGHRVTVLTADAPDLQRHSSDPDTVSSQVVRSLKLCGAYASGGVRVIDDPEEASKVVFHNYAVAADQALFFQPDCIILGNLDLLGFGVVSALMQHERPMLHCLGLPSPGFPPELAPPPTLYRMSAASRWLAADLRAAGYMARDEDVVYPGARTSFFYHHLLPSTDKLRIVYAGLVMPYKGAHTLVQALALLQQRGIDAECLIAGDSLLPDFVARLKGFIVQQGMDAKITLCGFLDRIGLRNAFSGGNVLVFPSEVNETFGIVPVEAMAAGLAVISTGTGGNAEVVRDRVDGVLFEKAKPHALADALADLATDRAFWDRMCAAGRERSLAFGVHVQVDHLETMMLEMVDGVAAV